MNRPKLKREDLQLGMMVTREQLDDIYDTWIFLVKEKRGDSLGRIAFIGDKTNAESDKVLNTGRPVTPIYNDSMLCGGDISYDE